VVKEFLIADDHGSQMVDINASFMQNNGKCGIKKLLTLAPA
jgi:hypothetical protein